MSSFPTKLWLNKAYKSTKFEDNQIKITASRMFLHIILLVHFIVNLCRPFFAISEKNGSWPKWISYINVSDKSKKCLSVVNSRILSVVCGQLPACPTLCRSLEYLLKVRYIILVVSKVSYILLQDGNTALRLNITKMNGIYVW